MDIEEFGDVKQDVVDEIAGSVVIDESVLESILMGFLARGHVLIEDVPGTGKTLTAVCLSEVFGLDFKRIQFTPDLLPSDVTGTNVYDEKENHFRFNEGPIFGNVVLADEINRAPPKTQAALLEAMGEKQVTVDGETRELPSPFFVIATQNPVEQEGTFPLPESQLDRFMVKTELGYPSQEGDLELIDGRASRREKKPSVEQVMNKKEVRKIQYLPEKVEVKEEIRLYISEICRRTRLDSRIEVGVSPRGMERFFEMSRASALVDGRDFVIPKDVKRVAVDTLPHRTVLTPKAKINDIEKTEVVKEVLESVKVPKHDSNTRENGNTQTRQ